MRIACVYLPSFPLQAALIASAGSVDLHLPSPHPVAVVSQPRIGAPVVLACSRAAWAAGVRPTMSASVARALVADLDVRVADVAGERALLRAAADALLSLTPQVDLGGDPRGQHHCLYLEVPTGRRGTWFGARVIEVLGVFGLRSRVGIADDRFTAYVAAATSATAATAAEAAPRSRATTGASEDVVCVPRGGLAAFLAPCSLSLLQLAPEVQHLLEALGVRTLGAFADLPPPSVTRAPTAWDADFQALARGDGGGALDAYAPRGDLIEHADLTAGAVGAAVDGLARRLAYRLAGRGTPPVLSVQLTGAGGEVAHRLELGDELDADQIADAIGRLLGDDSWASVSVIAAGEVGEPAAADTTPAGRVLPAPSPRHEVEMAPLVQSPAPTLFGRAGERPEHRRTRRGKQRPRIGTGQARLFAGD